MTTRQLTGVSCDCPGGAHCPDPTHDAGDGCENAVTIRTNKVAVARLTAMERFGFSVVPAPKGSYVLGDHCRACTDWGDVEALTRACLRAMGWATDGLGDIMTKIRTALTRDMGPL